MKLTPILLFLQISISKARPFGNGGFSKASKEIGYSEDPWNYTVVSPDDMLDDDYSNPGNGMFIAASQLEELKKQDQPDSMERIQAVFNTLIDDGHGTSEIKFDSIYEGPYGGSVFGITDGSTAL
ncbi:uncharacterized protein MELLADRAFT_108072 [Melampsora larici-populina 98AG31]|uniref:Secreted protein n=1 Tax=Melampsora larici-populina (strain 98AG31 / pathotype 3-4-7) TaxID=747676 RepID=F4RRV6_MELLP|nr:uncharacterized protein MELLADRAFT_108072 [Melampsora larici-populina 98AG31]EGG04885.1 hypothetical protein MELLADRAFT_108072 [Melampsora larici-populina 98AG31]